MARFEREPSEYIEKVVATNRVSKTVKGGRVMKFSALMVVGDGKGKVGFGLGKAAEVPEAIRKGIEDAKKNMITVSLSGSTIPHEIIGEAGAGRVLMKPAAPGTGVIAGAVFQLSHFLQRNTNFKDLVFQVSVFDGFFNIDFYFVLIPGISMNNIPFRF